MNVSKIISRGILRISIIAIIALILYVIIEKIHIAMTYSWQEIAITTGVTIILIIIFGIIPEEIYYKFDRIMSKIPFYSLLVNLSLLLQVRKENPSVYWVEIREGVYSLGILMNPMNKKTINIDETTSIEVYALIFPVAFGIFARVEWVEKRKLIATKISFRQAMLSVLTGGNR